MKILVLGSGGREHAVIKKLKENTDVEVIYALPGNGGMADDAICVPIAATDLEAVKNFALKKNIDYAVITSDDPLASGAVDLLTDSGIPCFGPCRLAAEIESSKAFAKQFMQRHNIPTARYRVFERVDEAHRYIEQAQLPIVVKADGLALGKGVIIAHTKEQAIDAATSMLCDGKFGESGRKVVIEEFMRGKEASVLAFCDGKTVLPMVSAMDYKRVGEGDKGLNTGGMGAIAPNPYYTSDIARQCMLDIILPTVRGLAQEGRAFKGCLYFGLMLTDSGAKVVEYNCRFGDPETQAVLPLLHTDLLTLMLATTNGTLDQLELQFSAQSCCVVVMASGGYPLAYDKGFAVELSGEVNVYYAGVRRTDDGLVTSGGRVLNVYAVAPTLRQAVHNAYAQLDKVSFKNSYYRNDIGAQAIADTNKD